MVKYISKFSYSDFVSSLLFLYVGVVYYSVAISNMVMGLAVFLFVIGLITKKVDVNFDTQLKFNYLLVIIPFLLTVASVLMSTDFNKGLEYVWLRIPVLVLPFIVIFNKERTVDGVMLGAKLFIYLSIFATLVSLYNAAVLFLDQGVVFLDPNFSKFITLIQHPYFGIFHLIAIVLLIEFKLCNNKKQLAAFLFVLSIGVILSTSRLSYLLGFFMVSFYTLKKLPKRFAIPVVVLILGITSITIASNEGLKYKIIRTFEYKNSPRLWLWNNTYKVMKNSDAPLLGVGIGDFYSEKKDPYYFRESEKGTMGYNPHNQYLEFILTNGVFGLLFIVSMLFVFYRIRSYSLVSKLIFVIIASFAFTETIFNRQYGVQLYSVFIPFVITLNTINNYGKHI